MKRITDIDRMIAFFMKAPIGEAEQALKTCGAIVKNRADASAPKVGRPKKKQPEQPTLENVNA